MHEVLQLLAKDISPHLYNVNVPPNARGITWTKQSVRHHDGKIMAAKDLKGRPHFRFTVVPLSEPEQGTDRWAIERGEISITPLRLDLTDNAELARLRNGQLAVESL